MYQELYDWFMGICGTYMGDYMYVLTKFAE